MLKAYLMEEKDFFIWWILPLNIHATLTIKSDTTQVVQLPI